MNIGSTRRASVKYRILIYLTIGLLSSASASAWADLGGQMGNCYTGVGFRANVTCEEARAAAAGTVTYWNPIIVSTHTRASYADTSGNRIAMSVDLVLYDRDDYFNPEPRVPVVVRAIVCGFHRYCTYRAESYTVVLEREAGTRSLSGNLRFELRNDLGADYVERLDKYEILVPGMGQILVVDI
jgi:hypothetical protein